MHLGVTVMATDRTMDITELAVVTEELGFDSLWLPEHTHIPTSRLTPAPTGGTELSEDYKRILDPLVGLSFAAASTSRLRIGTGIMLPAQRDPIVTAKAIATLAHLSGGRFDLGIGFGWNREEMESHGVDYSTRRAHTREHVLAMQNLWNDEIASFDGDFTTVQPSWSWPKPESPIPILLGGGAGPKLFSHIVEYCDGWIPIGGRGLGDAIPELRNQFEQAGRDPATLRIMPFGSLPDPGKLDHFRSLGVTECVFPLSSGDRDEILPLIEHYAAVVTEWRGS